MLDGLFVKFKSRDGTTGFRLIKHDFSDWNGLLNSYNSCKTRECVPLVLYMVLK